MKSNWETLRDEIVEILNRGQNRKVAPDTQRNFLEEAKSTSSTMVGPQSPEIGDEHLESGGRISSEMGRRTHPITGEKGKMHGGVDIASLGKNAKAYAVHAGEVTFAGYAGNAGNMVKIEYFEGEDKHEIIYMHLDQISVRPGDKVQKHQVVGIVGNTGGSTGVHLHLEHKVNGQRQRPTNEEINLSVMRAIA